MNHRPQTRPFLQGASAFVLCTAFAATTLAQSGTSEPTEAEKDEQTGRVATPPVGSPDSATSALGEALQEIVVTGSRVATNGFSAPTPVTVIDASKIETLAPITVGEALVRMPGFRDLSSSEQRGRFLFGAQYRMDLRGLGAERTLVLVDSRRFIPTNANGMVNTNMIPFSMVERIDVVTGGASSAYGSDAVSGVVNFILRERFQGLKAQAQYGASQEGDADQRTFSLVAGTSLLENRLHLVAGGDYSSSHSGGTIYSRDWSRDEEFLVSFGANRPAGTPAQGYLSNVTYGSMTEGSLVLAGPLSGTAFGPGGEPFAFQPGTRYGNLMVGGGTPTVNPAGNYRMAQPVERHAVLGRLTYELTDNLTLFAEASTASQSTDGYIAWYQSPSFTVNIDNPFIPEQTRAQMQQLGLTSLRLGRINTDLGGGRYWISEYGTDRYVAGGRGQLSDAISWDAYVEHGESHQSLSIPTNVLPANFLAAVYAVTGPDGQPACGPIDTNPNLSAAQRSRVQPGCVPFNVFGPNSRSQAALEYAVGNSFWRDTLKQDVVALNLRFKPFATWAGAVSAATGVEWREHSVRRTADPLSEVNAYSLQNTRSYTGTQSVKEAYLELLVPLAANAAWADAVDLNIAGRVTDYRASGTVETWKVGLTYDTPFGLRLRGARSRDIRAPALFDLFTAGGFSTLLSNGVNPFNGRQGAVNQAGGGNPNLVPEVADTITAGVVYQPEWLPGFGASIDYYDIKVNDVIDTPTAATILNQCAAGVQRYCDLIVTDDSEFGIAFVRANPANLAERRASGVDIELNYRLAASRVSGALPGDLVFRAIGTYVEHLLLSDGAGTIERAGSAADGSPKWNWNLDATYRTERFSTTLNLRYFNSFKGDSALRGPEDSGYDPTAANSVNINRFPGKTYVNWSASLGLPTPAGELQLYTTINNVLDQDPPKFALVAMAQGGTPYPVLGRYYRVGMRYSF